MTRSTRRAIAVAVCLALLGTWQAIAGGLYGVASFYTLDLSQTIGQIPVAGDAVFAAMGPTFLDMGASPAQLEEIEDDFDEAVTQIQEVAEGLPLWLPIPLLGAGIEIDLPLVLIDGVRLSGGLLTDGMLRTGVGLAGVEIPDPLIDEEFTFDTISGSIAANLEFTTWMLSTEVVKRFELFLLAANLGGGVDLIGGDVDIALDLDVPSEFEDGVADALEALHLEALHWSSFAIHGTLGFELGPPFLRLYGDVRWLLPIGQAEDWWKLRVAPVAGMIGLVIRF